MGPMYGQGLIFQHATMSNANSLTSFKFLKEKYVTSNLKMNERAVSNFDEVAEVAVHKKK